MEVRFAGGEAFERQPPADRIFIKKEPMSEKQLAGYMDEDEQGVGTELCVLQAVGLVSAEKEGTAAIVVSADGKPGGMEDLSDTDVFGMLQERAHRTDDVRFHLTELGEELLPLCRELERLDVCMRLRKTWSRSLWVETISPGQNLTGLQQAAQMQVPHKIRKTILTICLRKSFCKGQAWFLSGGQCVCFFNPHCEFEDWYFYGETAGEMTELYLITDPEYQLFLAALKNAGSAPKDQAMLKLHFHKNS